MKIAPPPPTSPFRTDGNKTVGGKFALQYALTKVWVEGEFQSFVSGLNWNILLQNTPPSRIHMELKLLAASLPYIE